MRRRGSNIWPSATRGASTLPCRHCGRPAGNGRGDIIYVDSTPAGKDTAEHARCRRERLAAPRDYLTPRPDGWLP
jgi:hypothetical protein